MSINGENIEHTVEVEDTLLQILRELRYQTMILLEMTDSKLKIGDLDE